ncbi:MAG: FAD-binding oxidoreductase [Thermomicrobia bacterium]|nr:FAD-binding oxidoreductase [Thermomicrobia bacterium]MCA1725305.1 FAD-binding oxidoreductase [Thermomicrobia bacterium]
MTAYDLIIIGAGNLGLWTAHELARRGFGRIAVCERTWAGFGATTRSAGVVRQQGGSETAIKLGIWSRARYLSLGAELGLDSGFSETGYYVLAETEQERAAFHELVALRRACGMENEWLDAAEGRKRFPGLDWENLLGATYTANDGYVHPPIVARNITVAATRNPAIDLFERCTVEGIEQTGNTYAVRTTRGTFTSDRVLDAGGPRGARAIGAMVGVTVPVSAARHLVVTYPDLPPFPMFFALAKGVYVRPEEQGALLGLSNPEEQADRSDHYQLDFDWDYFARMRPAWESVFPALAGQRVSRSWAGSIDYTPDHLPIIDQPLAGFYVLAAGGHGMMWGPALGMTMAELIADGTVRDLPADEIRLDRFRAGYVHHDAIALPFPTT